MRNEERGGSGAIVQVKEEMRDRNVEEDRWSEEKEWSKHGANTRWGVRGRKSGCWDGRGRGDWLFGFDSMCQIDCG